MKVFETAGVCLLLMFATSLYAQTNPPEEKKRTPPAREKPATQPASKPAPQPPANQPAAQPARERPPHERPAAQPANKPAGQPANEPAGQPANGRARQPAPPAAQPVNQPAAQPTNQPQPAGQPVNPPVAPTGPPARDARGDVRAAPVGQPVAQDRPANVPIRTANGGEVRRGSNGAVIDVHTSRGIDIHHGPGVRVVTIERPDHSIVVTNRAGHGYVQRPYVFRDEPLIHRAYYVNGVAYARVYRPYRYRGLVLNVYAPSRYYSPAFYTWADAPWGAPVAYRWGWGGTPWYGYYGGYFSPYPVYSSPSFWLTDYMLAATLEASYQERMAEAANAQATYYGNAMPLTPDVKQAIGLEVQRQLALERAEGQMGVQTLPDPTSSSIAQMLSDSSPHVFVVSSGLQVALSSGGECPLTPGDVLQLGSSQQPDADAASLVVLASKFSDCHRGTMVWVPLADLQDMQNHMRATVDQGLVELQSKQGQNGLPPMPAAAARPPSDTAYAAEAPPADPNIATELRQQAQAADRAEKEVLDQAPPQNPGRRAPATIARGQSIEEVVAILGEPTGIADVGAKKIYLFKDLKVTFINGKVSDVQ